MASGNVVHEEIKQPFLFGHLHTLDPGDEFAVKEETLLAGHRVHADERMDGIDGFFADKTAGQAGVVDHLG